MSRRKSPVLLPQPGASILRRSARLNSLQSLDGQGKSSKDLVFGSVPPSKNRWKIESEASKRLTYSSGGSIEGSSSPRRSYRLSSSGYSNASKEKSPLCSSTKPSSKSTNVSSSCILRRTPRFSDARTEKSPRCIDTKSVSTPSSRMKTTNVTYSSTLRRSPRFSSGGGSLNSLYSSNGSKLGNTSVLSRCSTKSISSDRGKGGDGVKSRERSKSRALPKTKQMFRHCDDDDDNEECDDDDDDDDNEEEEEISVCLAERKKMRIEKPNEEENAVGKADKGKRIGKEEKEEERLKTKNKVDEGWTGDLELALQGAYLTVKPSPNFWKKVAKMVPGKSAQECFDRVNSDLITPRQPQPRSRARKTNLSPIPQFSLSASKLLKPNSPKIKIRQGRNNLSKKTIRHLLEKQNHMDQGLEFDLFSVLEPSTSSNFLSTPMEKRQSLPKILESPRSASKYETALVSPPVLKQVKNKALHEKYIDHLHMREAKRKAESTRMARKENIRPIDIQKKDSVRAAKDAIFFELQDAVQKLKVIEAEKSSSSPEFCDDQDDEEESI